MSLLRLEGVTKRFGGLVAVKNMSFEMSHGEILGLIGPNGSGKTTLFNLITGTFPPDEGRIIFDGHDITGKPPHRVVPLGMARTFQITSLFPGLTAAENVLTAQHIRLKASMLSVLAGTGFVRHEEARARAEALRILELVGLAQRADVPAANLSSAEQRRLMIAVGLATKPKLLLLDEPAAGMTSEEREALVDLIRAIRHSGVSVLVVEHHMGLIMQICDRIVVINFGERIAMGTPAEVKENPKVVEAYLGRSV